MAVVAPPPSSPPSPPLHPPSPLTHPTPPLPATNTPPSSSRLFIAGALGGVAECFVVQPLDVVKTRFQLNTGTNQSVWGALRHIYNEGGMMRYYRGVLPELIGMIPKSSAMYSAYETTKNTLRTSNNHQMTTQIAFIAGAVSGLPEALTVQPFQVVKVRLQAREYLGKYRNTFDCAHRMMREEGVRAFGTGFSATVLRNSVWNSVYFAVMHRLKVSLPTPSNLLIDSVQTLTTGFAGGIIATMFNAPFDVCKSRFQSQLVIDNGTAPAAGTGKRKYTSVPQTLRLVYHEEGARALYKGFAPKALRMGIGGGVCMMVFEAVVRL